jgi:hypothetical protein
MDRRKLNGGNSTKAVRPDDKRLLSKTELQDAFTHLAPLSEEAIKVHAKAIKAGERWAIELFYKYYFKMPTQTIDNNVSVSNFDINKLYDKETQTDME